MDGIFSAQCSSVRSTERESRDIVLARVHTAEQKNQQKMRWEICVRNRKIKRTCCCAARHRCRRRRRRPLEARTTHKKQRAQRSSNINQHCSDLRARSDLSAHSSFNCACAPFVEVLRVLRLRRRRRRAHCNLGLILYSPFMICGDIRVRATVQHCKHVRANAHDERTRTNPLQSI